MSERPDMAWLRDATGLPIARLRDLEQRGYEICRKGQPTTPHAATWHWDHQLLEALGNGQPHAIPDLAKPLGWYPHAQHIKSLAKRFLIAQVTMPTGTEGNVPVGVQITARGRRWLEGRINGQDLAHELLAREANHDAAYREAGPGCAHCQAYAKAIQATAHATGLHTD